MSRILKGSFSWGHNEWNELLSQWSRNSVLVFFMVVKEQKQVSVVESLVTISDSATISLPPIKNSAITHPIIIKGHEGRWRDILKFRILCTNSVKQKTLVNGCNTQLWHTVFLFSNWHTTCSLPYRFSLYTCMYICLYIHMSEWRGLLDVSAQCWKKQRWHKAKYKHRLY